MPVTTPDKLTVPQGGLLLLQEPPAVGSPSEVVLPWHTVRVPVIGAGSGLTVTRYVVNPPPEKL